MEDIRVGQLLSIPLFIVSIGNIITNTSKGLGLEYYIFNVCLVLIIALFLLFSKVDVPDNTLSVILLILCLSSIFNQHLSALNDVLFFSLATYISHRPKKYYLYQGLIYVILLTINYTLLNTFTSEIIVHLGGVSFALIIFYKKVYLTKKYKYIINHEDTKIDPTVRAVMEQYIKGNSWDDISKILKLNVTGKRVQKIVKKEMVDKKFNNYAHLCHYMANEGIIKAIDKTTIT